jgi:hypothetical protein
MGRKQPLPPLPPIPSVSSNLADLNGSNVVSPSATTDDFNTSMRAATAPDTETHPVELEKVPSLPSSLNISDLDENEEEESGQDVASQEVQPVTIEEPSSDQWSWWLDLDDASSHLKYFTEWATFLPLPFPWEMRVS